MKRVGIVLASMLVLLTLLTPATALAAGSGVKAAVVATATGTLIVYPEVKPDITAEAAYASTPWEKSGDTLNLVLALVSVGAVVGIIVWGVLASRAAGRPAA